jgi:ACT domain-containing protein
MRAVLSVIGKDKVGILAQVAAKCAEYNVSIIDVSQTVLQEMFTMIMIVDIENISVPFGNFADVVLDYGKQIGMDIRAMHEDIFNSMHRL